MNILVIYDSHYGNGATIAKTIADALKSDNQVDLVKINSKPIESIESYNLVVVGSPTISFMPTKLIMDFVLSLPSNLANTVFAVYDTNTPPLDLGKCISFLVKLFKYSNDTLIKILEKKNLKITASKKFYVSSSKGPLKKGEVEKAVEFANHLNSKPQI